MGLIVAAIVIGVVFVGIVVYQLYKSKKAVTGANIVATAASDVAAAKNDVKKS